MNNMFSFISILMIIGYIYLWSEGNMPATTVYTSNPYSQYFDDPDFRPYMVYFPAKEGPYTQQEGALDLARTVRDG